MTENEQPHHSSTDPEESENKKVIKSVESWLQEDAKQKDEPSSVIEGVEEWLNNDAKTWQELKNQLEEFGIVEDLFFDKFETKDVGQALALALPLKKQLELSSNNALDFNVKGELNNVIYNLIKKGEDRHQKEFRRASEPNWYEVALVLIYLMKDILNLEDDSVFQNYLKNLNNFLETDFSFL